MQKRIAIGVLGLLCGWYTSSAQTCVNSCTVACTPCPSACQIVYNGGMPSVTPASVQMQSPEHLADQLHQAQSEKSLQRFFSILQTALALFAHDEDAFSRFLNTRNSLQWTALMTAAMMGDVVQITALLRCLERHYGDNQEAIFQYLNQQSPVGYTALLFACGLGKLDSIRALVDGVAELLDGNKKLFLAFLNTPDFVKENNPLLALVYDSQHEPIRYIILKAQQFFGKSSVEYDEFVNFKDASGFTPLQYALDVRDRNFLMSHRAIVKGIFSPEVKEALQLGEKLITVMHQDNVGVFKKLLFYIENKYKGRPDLLAYALEARNGAGWSLITHAASDSMLYMKLVIPAAEKGFRKNTNDIFDTLGTIDHLGRTGLIIAIQRENFDSAHYLLDKILEYSRNNYYFYSYVVTQVATNGFSALMSAIYKNQGYGSLYDFVKFLLDTMASLFGKESREFYLFINECDFNHYTALDYADSNQMQALLVDYGAQYGSVVRKQFKRDLAQAQSL